MKLTLLFALVTVGLTQLGATPLAEVTYIVAAALAWSQGRRAIAQSMSHVHRETRRETRLAALASHHLPSAPRELPHPSQSELLALVLAQQAAETRGIPTPPAPPRQRGTRRLAV